MFAGDHFFYFLGAPGNRRCTAEHDACLYNLVAVELQCQGNTCQGKVPGSTGAYFSIGTVQSLRRRRQKNLSDDFVGFQDGLFLNILAWRNMESGNGHETGSTRPTHPGHGLEGDEGRSRVRRMEDVTPTP